MPLKNPFKSKKSFAFKLWHQEKDLKILKRIGIFVVILASVITIGNELISDDFSQDNVVAEDVPKDDCNVLGIELHGDLVTYISPADYGTDGNPTVDQTASQDVYAAVQNAEADDKIKAIFLEVDSYGGSPVAAEEIEQMIKNTTKPTVALIRSAGTSAAYWSATGADRIIASKNSDIGGIGVTMSYVDNVRQNQDQGLTYNSLSVGKFKDYGDPNKPLTAEEKKILMRDLNILHQNFIQTVATNRNLDLKKIEALADGSSMPGELALANGLIDQIGTFPDAKNYLAEKIGQKVEVCW